MDAVKILIPFFILLAAHIWARRWTWVPTWCAVASVIIAAETLAKFDFTKPVALLVSGLFAFGIWALLFWVARQSKKRTISNDIWMLFKPTSGEYNPIKGYACVSTWLLFAVYLALHFLFRW